MSSGTDLEVRPFHLIQSLVMSRRGVIRAGMNLWIIFMLVGCGPITFTIGGSPATKPLSMSIVQTEGGWLGPRVAIIDVSGMLSNGPKRGLLSTSENPTSLLHEKLERARTDPRVKAVLLRLNTPGGTVTASDAMYRQLIRFKERSGKPVVAIMMDVAASGGYYLACAADRIVAYPSTVTGSIGVIIQTISFKPAMDRLGIDAEAIVSGPNKDAGSPFSKLTEEHRQVLRSMLDDFYIRFVTLVRRSRSGIPAGRFDEVTDGRVYSGDAALKVGLVDEVGDLHDAFALAKGLAGVKRAELVMYHRPNNTARTPYAAASGVAGSPGANGLPGPGGVQINLAQINLAENPVGRGVGFYYLWQPTRLDP